PLGRDPPLVPERTELRVGAVIVKKARKKLGDDRLPARIGGVGQSPLERRLVGVDEALAHLLRRLPAAVGDAGGAVEIFGVLLDELPAIGAQRGIEKLDRGDAIVVYGSRRLPHAVEYAHHLVLA